MATRRTLGAAVIAGLGLAAAMTAGGQALADPVDLRVVDRDTGRVLPIWRHEGRLYVAGRPGARYGLRVSNHTGRRVLVVMSVDGVNVLSGETAGIDQRGYIFGPYDHYDITGWRKSQTEVAAFTFAAQSQSYAARTGRPMDVGVIGIAVFDERPPPPPTTIEEFAPSRGRGDASREPAPVEAPKPPPPLPLPPPIAPAPRSAAGAASDMAAPAMRSAPRDEKLGTAHGAREWSVSQIESFERASSRPFFTRQIEYDTYANLVAGGVIPRHVAPPPRHPRPFPDTPDDSGYAPDPPDEG